MCEQVGVLIDSLADDCAPKYGGFLTDVCHVTVPCEVLFKLHLYQ